MVPQAGNINPSSQKRIRAKQACTSCHARRIRCNVTEVHPCFNCLSTGCICEIVPSRRGRHKRPPRPTRPTPPSESGESPQDPRLTREPEASTQDGFHPSATDQPLIQELGTGSPVSQHRGERTTIPSRISDSGTAPSSLMDCGMFFGESNALTCVASEKYSRTASSPSPRQKPRYYSVPENPDATVPGDDTTGIDWALKEQILRLQGALDVPTQERYTAILQAYFKWFHPCFPIVDKVEFGELFLQNRISPLLLNAMLFVGVTYCEENAWRNLGYTSLGQAKSQLYDRAKLLFEADWETNGLTILQALFLLTFVRVPMSCVKGHRYWLSAAINLAHTYGLHRAPSQSSSSTPTQAKLRRRIWWSLYVREIHSSTSLGLPPRIRDEDCDVPMLSSSDIMDETTPSVPWLADPPTCEQVIYAISMPRLMILLSQIANRFFAPKPSGNQGLNSREDFMGAIEKWKRDMPPDMQTDGVDGGTTNMWTCLLHLAYNHLIILLHRDDFMSHRLSGQNAVQAARRVTRIAEELLAESTIKYSQLYLVTSVFAALCIHTIDLQQSQGVARRLGENRAKICLLGLKEAQKSWDINNDILDLFFHHIEARLAEEFQKAVADYVVRTNNPTLARSDDQNNYTNNHAEVGWGQSERPATNSALSISHNGNHNEKEVAGPTQGGMTRSMYDLNDLSSQTDGSMIPFLSPVPDFCIGEDMGIREFDLLQRWF